MEEIEQVHANIVEIRPHDPYDTPEEHAETNDWIFNTFFFWTGAGGTFSTWRERHIFLRGFFNGFNTELQAKFDPIPVIWEDEGQYYEFGQEAGYVVRNALIFAFTGSIATLSTPTILDIIKSVI